MGKRGGEKKAGMIRGSRRVGWRMCCDVTLLVAVLQVVQI